MSKVSAVECDGCHKVMTKASEHYQLTTKPFVTTGDPEARSEPRVMGLDFCEMCARSLKGTLERLEKRLEDMPVQAKRRPRP